MPVSNASVRTGGIASLADWTSAALETESILFSNAAKFHLRPLQVTWEMTQACYGKRLT